MYNSNQQELEILKYWEEHKCFEKSVSERPEDKPYVFYDGPPFATGLPHYGHIVASLMKDVVPRYWTMRGFRVERKWGWDCHGLPIENIIEKKLDLKSKADIEKMGICNFNEACRDTVLTYAEEWKKTIKRMGRWVDMEDDYKTMDKEYMESVWWVFKQLWDKGLIYEGYKSMHICPRCETPLSNFEVTQGYKDVKDISVVAKFRIKNYELRIKGIDGPVYILAWTTTPWTLPGNVLLAVGECIKYYVLSIMGEEGLYVMAKDRVEVILIGKEFEVVEELTGKDLVGLEYEPLFPYFANTENGFRVVAGDFVSTEEGTGIVHIAPAFGEDDYQVGKREKTGWVQHVTMEGKFIDEVTDFVGQEVKPKDDPTKTDVEIIKYLAKNGKLFSKQKFEHSYPHCWRCDTPLLNYATSSWFVKVTELKEKLLQNNKKITWVPEHIKEGRFGKWLEGARDWAISRSRYWGCPLPIWKSEDGDVICVSNAKELEELGGQKIDDLHKHFVDEIIIKKDGKEYKRIPEVLDCWFESGSMPYGQMNYPYNNKEKFEAGFPAEFIAEGQDQTRGWFYTLHVLATALTSGQTKSIPQGKRWEEKNDEGMPAFKNVIVNGIVLAEDGKKMSKRLNNYPDPTKILEQYGADAMRYYLVSSPVMHAESLNFSESGVREMYNKVVNTIWNVLEFYQMYASESQKSKVKSQKSNSVLDKWILAKLQLLVKEITERMNEYKLAEASRPIVDFISELSQWYVRRSRNRFKIGNDEEKANALVTLREILLTLSKIMAPFTPFIAEKIYLSVGGSKESVHLEEWPAFVRPGRTSTGEAQDKKVIADMGVVRKIAEMGLAIRAEKNVKVRQPLGKLEVVGCKLQDEYLKIISDELNVKSVVNVQNVGIVENVMWKEYGDLKVGLDMEITDDLKKEGLVREIVRSINQMRKDKNLSIDKKAVVEYATDDEILRQIFVDYRNELMKNTASIDIKVGQGEVEVKIDGRELKLSITEI